MSHSNVCYEFQNKGNCYRKNCKFDHIPASRQAINQPKKEANNPNQSSYFPAAHQSSFSQGARAYPVDNFSSSPNPRQSDDRRYNQTQSKTISRSHFRGLPSSDQASKVNSRPNPPDDGINRNVVLVSNNFYNTKPPREDYPETRQVMYTEAIQFNPTVPPPVGKLPPPITTPNCTSVNPNLQRAKAELNKLEKTLEDRSTWMNDPKNTPQDCIQILQEKMNKRQKLMDFIKSIESQDLKEGKCSSQEEFKASQRVSNFEEKARRSRSRSRDECGTDRKSRKRHRSSSNFTNNSRRRRGSSYSSRDSHSPLKSRRKSSPSRLDRNHSNIKDETPMRRKDESPKRRRRSRSESRSERNKSLYDRNICQNIKEESPKRRYRSGSESRIERNRSRSDKNCSNIEDGSQKRRHRSGSESRGERNASRLERNNCSNVREENQRSRRESQSENRRDNCERRLDRSNYSNVKQENRMQHKSPSEIRRASNEGRLDRSNFDNVNSEKPRRRRESHESNENRLSRNKVSNSNQEMDKSIGKSNIRRDGGESPFQQNFCMNIKQERINIKQERDFVGPGKKHARIWIPPKHGEPWVCKECGGNTVAWRPKCFHCEAPMPGNWKCMKAKCGTINWKKSMACNTCLRENPNVWICQAEGCGEFNWNTKKVCHTCHKSEGRALPDDRGVRGTNRRSRDFNRDCKPFRDERNFNERGNHTDVGNDFKRNPDNDRHSFERMNSASGSKNIESEKLDGDEGGEKDPSYWKRYFEEQKEKNKKENEIQNSKSLEINKRLAMLAGNYLTAEGEPVVVQECDSGEDEIEWLDEIGTTGDCSEGMEVPGPSELGLDSQGLGNNRSERTRALSPESPWEKIRSPKRGTKTREEICIDVSDSEDEPNEDVVFERGELALSKTQKKTNVLGKELGSASDKRKDPIQIERGVRENNSNMMSSPSKRASDVLKSPAKRVHVIASPPIRVSEESSSPRVSNPPTRVSDAVSKPSERATDIVTSQGSPVCIDLDEEDVEQLGPASPDPNISRRKANSIGETLQREKDKQSLENSQLGLKNLESSSSTCKVGSMIEKPTRDKLKQSLDLSTLGPASLEQNKSSHTVGSREEKSRGEKPKQSLETSPQDPQQGNKASPPGPPQGQKKKLKLSDYKLRKKASEENHCNASSSKSSQDSVHIKDAASSATNTQENSNNRKPPDAQTIHEDDDIVVIQSKDKH